MARKCKDWITSYLEYVTESEPPNRFKEWVAISTVAAVLQRKVSFSIGVETVHPNLYIVLVGPSGSRKSTSMRPARRILEKLGIALAADLTTKEALVQRLEEAGVEETFDPLTQTIRLHSSLTIHSSELVVFLGYSNLELMSNLTDWFDCNPNWRKDTKTQGSNEIIAPWVNMIGATTPDLLRSSLPENAIGGGFTSRLILIYGDKKSKIIPIRLIDEKEKILGQHLEEDLQDIHLLQGEFLYDESFVEPWIDFVYESESKKAITDPRFSGYLDRRRVHILKLCMIFNASRHDGKMLITSGDLQRSIAALKDAEIQMTRAFAGVGKSRYADILDKVMLDLVKEKVIPYSKLVRRYYHDVSEWEMGNVIKALSDMKYCRRIIKPDDDYIEYISQEGSEETKIMIEE